MKGTVPEDVLKPLDEHDNLHIPIIVVLPPGGSNLECLLNRLENKQ